MKLGYRVEGRDEAPPLVLSPSLGTTISLWEAQVDALARDFRVIRHDHPGHGISPIPTGRVAVATIAEGVLDILDELDLPQASFAGISLGGMVGMWVGANAPERIDRLVLAATGASLGTPVTYMERAALVRAEGTRAVVDGARERWFTPAFAHSQAAERILAELGGVPSEGYAACCEAVGAFDFHDDLDRIAAPTLVVIGEEDPLTTPETVEALVQGIPDTRLVSISGASHLVNVEQPEVFTGALLAHLVERTPA
jgi:3-oxoadipate enol-lactonase